MIISSSFWTVYSIEGGARHVYYLTLDQGIRASRLNWISQPFTIMALATGKASVAFFLLRILGPSKWRKPFLYFVTISSLIGCGIDSILSFVQCKPVGRLWDSRIDGHCWNPRVQADFALVLAGEQTPFLKSLLLSSHILTKPWQHIWPSWTSSSPSSP